MLDELGIELIGASIHAIETAEDRELFAPRDGGARPALRALARSSTPSPRPSARSPPGTLPLPLVIRPAFTLGGQGGGFASTLDELRYHVERGVAESPIGQVLLEESLLGWDEFELEVIRDRLDNVIIVCSIENLDPMGVHTGDSVCVAPAMTLSDREYQALRDAAVTVIRAVGVETGGSNVQFAVNRETGEIVVIEMNPRVSRSSALASKATGYPIAKVATKLAIGYTLDEIPNDLTQTTPASFEPTLDYVVVKMPRFAFEKFPGSDERLTTQMKSVGEAMSIGRTFCEAFGKALRSRELDTPPRLDRPGRRAVLGSLRHHPGAAARGRDARGAGGRGRRAHLVPARAGAHGRRRGGAGRRPASGGITPALWRRAKRHGLGDSWLAKRLGAAEADVRAARHRAPACVPSTRRSTRAPPRSRRAPATATRRTRTSTSRSRTTGRAC